MVRPVVADLTERAYRLLPFAYRAIDETLDFPLLRWLSLLCDQADESAQLLERFDPVNGPSHLTDPDLADVEWLPWLAQMTGTYLTPGMDETGRRDAIRTAIAGFRVGTKAAVADAAASALTGTRYVTVHPHSIVSPGDGSMWDVLLVTRTSETPDVLAVLAAVIEKRAKPAGVVLHHRAYTASWGAVETDHPTWADIDGNTWATLEETGL